MRKEITQLLDKFSLYQYREQVYISGINKSTDCHLAIFSSVKSADFIIDRLLQIAGNCNVNTNVKNKKDDQKIIVGYDFTKNILFAQLINTTDII